MQTLRKFLPYYRPYMGVFFLDLLCAAVISIVDLLYPQLLRRLGATLFLQDADTIRRALPLLGLALLAAYVLQALCHYYVTCQGHIMGARMERDMRRELFTHYERLSFSYYDKSNTGQLMSRLISDLFDISEMAHHGPENLFISLVKLVGSFIFLFLIQWRLAIILLAVVLVMIVVSYKQNRAMRATFADNRRKIGDINETLNDSLSGIRVAQAFANEDMEEEKFRRGNEAFLASKRRNYQAMGRFNSTNTFFIGMIYLVTVVCGGFFVAAGQMTAGDLAMVALYIGVFVSPIKILVELVEMLQKGMSGFRRFREVVEELPEIKDAPDAKPIADPKGDIVFDDVRFSYGQDQTAGPNGDAGANGDGSASKNTSAGGNKDTRQDAGTANADAANEGGPVSDAVLDHLSFTVPSGKSIALVGPSGGGKTTICSLIPRFYDVTAGAITIGGQDVRKMTLKSLRQAIGIVQQDVYLFSGSVRENIAYGRPDATEEEIIEAAKAANIHDFVMTLPEGYDTPVGERGARLSGGQKQRISIARIFLKNPPILILDEATSALDNESEEYIQHSLDALSRGRTTITIAHRLSTIRNAEEILVIDESGICERGTHDELMKQDGVYRRYYQLSVHGEDQ